MGTAVEGLIFDLDNTLLDRQAVFHRVAVSFYEEYLRGSTRVSRDDAVEKMVEWDGDGYASKAEVFGRFLDEWPDTGLHLDSLTEWYRAETERQVHPDLRVNEYLVYLNEQQVPWGIVTNGSRSQHRKCRAAGLDEARAVHHRVGRGGICQARPEDISGRAGGDGSDEAGSGHVRRGQSGGRH